MSPSDVLKFVPTSKFTAFVRLYVGLLLSFSVVGGLLCAIGTAPGEPTIAAHLVMTLFFALPLAGLAALPMLLFCAVLFVILGGLK